MLTSANISTITDNFKKVDVSGIGTLNSVQATSVFYAIRENVCPQVTVHQFKSNFDLQASHTSNPSIDLESFLTIIDNLQNYNEHQLSRKMTIKKSFDKLATDVGVWFGVQEDPLSSSVWNLNSPKPKQKDERLLGDLSEIDMDERPDSSSNFNLARSLTKRKSSAGELETSSEWEEFHASDDEGTGHRKLSSRASISYKDRIRRFQEVGLSAESDIRLTLSKQANVQNDRESQIAKATNSFMSNLRKQYEYAKVPVHYAYANWFESDLPFVPETAATVREDSGSEDDNKTTVNFNVPENNDANTRPVQTYDNPLKAKLCKRPLINKAPQGKARPVFNRQGQKLKELDRDQKAAFAARPKYRPWINIITMLIMFILIIVEIVENDGIEPIGLSVRTESTDVTIFGGFNVTRSVSYAENMWIGPSTETILVLGAKYTPCMKRDKQMYNAMDQQIIETAAKETGCCVLSDNSCSRTNVETCNLYTSSTFSANETCAAQNCEIFNRPCCLSIYGECQLLGEEECLFKRGIYQSNREACSTASNCLNGICGMGGLSDQEKPNQWWRFITPVFLHVGIIHFILNTLFQLAVGVQIEIECGPVRFFFIFIISGIGGNIVSGIFSPYAPQVGSSGALYGLLAVLLIELFQYWPFLKSPKFELFKLGVMLIISLGIGTLPWIDNYAHIGGFIYGLVASVVFLPYITFGEYSQRRKRILLCIFAPLLVVMLIVGFVLFYVANEDFCTVCSYINCIPWTADFCANANQEWDGTY